MQHKIKLLNKEENWHRLRNYKPNDTVNHNNKLWQNVTGLNSEPNDTSNDWVDINLGVSEKDLESKLDKPTTNNTNQFVILGDGSTAPKSDFGKVKSVNGQTGDVILKTSDLQNDSDYTTNAILTAHTSNKANPHNVTKSQIGLGDVDNTSDLNKPISTATQTELNKKLDKPTTNNTPEYVLLADGSTAAKSDFGKVDKVMGVAPDANKNVDISGVAMNWTNASQRWSALPNKSGGDTYNKVMVLDADGKAGTKDVSDLGKNFANTDLVVTTNRKHIGTGSVEFGFPFTCSNASVRYSGLLDKSADTTFNNLLGVDSNGYAAKVGLNAVTNAMSKSTDAQKDALRNASLKTNETYSIGQPRVDSLLPPLLLGTNTSITLIGINLFLNTTSTTAKVETIDSRNNSVVETITNIAVYQTLPSKLMFNIDRNLYVDEVFYYVRVTHNGLTSIINTNAAFILFKEFKDLTVDYQWRVKTLRSQLEPKTYNLELKNTSDFIFKNTGKNSLGNYENAVINIVSDKHLESSKTYIIQSIVKYEISNTTNTEKIRFGIIPSNEIPTDESVVTSLLGTGIMGGGYDLNQWIQIPIPGAGRAKQAEYCNLTIFIRNRICLVIFKDVVYTLSLPTSMDGTYKLFFNITDSSEKYSAIEFVNTNFYQQ